MKRAGKSAEYSIELIGRDTSVLVAEVPLVKDILVVADAQELHAVVGLDQERDVRNAFRQHPVEDGQA